MLSHHRIKVNFSFGHQVGLPLPAFDGAFTDICRLLTQKTAPGHTTRGGQPVKVFEETEDATIKDETKIKVTTKTRFGGRWKTSVKYVKREQ